MNRRIGIELGKRIRQVRESRGLTQSHLAKLAGKSIETISNFERGRTIPSIQTLSHMAEALDLPLGQFFALDHTKVENDDRTVVRIAAQLKLVSKSDARLVKGFLE
jgi:transcriptional regulator with XRE-family HTH domain